MGLFKQGESVTKTIALLAPDLAGGVSTRVYLLAQVLQKLNYPVKVFGFLFGDKLYPPPPDNLEVTWVKGYNYPPLISSVYSLLRQIEGDILYAVKPKPTSLGVAILKRWQSRQPVILDMDDWELSWFGGDDWSYQPNPKRLAIDLFKNDGALKNPDHPLYIKWTERLINQVNGITVDSRFLQNRYGGDYLPNGKDTDLFDYQQYDAQTSRQKYGLGNYRILMFPGTARPHKGLEDVIAALELLNQPDLRLVIVGGTEINDGYLENLLTQGAKWIIKLPQQSIEAMPEVVSAAHIVVVPQKDTLIGLSQFPLKLTDGMAMAKPILSTYVGDIPEILADTGYLVSPNSPAELATKIQYIFDHWDEAITKGLKARQRCVEHYSTDAMAKTLAKVIEYLP